MVASKKTITDAKEATVAEAPKKIDIEQALRILLDEKEKREKEDKIKKYVWIAILVVCLYNAFIFFSMYSYFKSPEFLDNVKYQAIEAMPRISEELGKTAEKSAPIVFESMKNQFEAYLPVAQGKVLERYKQLNQQAIEISKKEFETAVNAQIASDITKMSESASGSKLTPEQFEELKVAMGQHIDKTVGDIIAKTVGDQLNMCVEGVNVMKQVGESLNQKTGEMSEKLNSNSEIERKKIGFDIFRSFLDAVDHKQTGRVPEDMKTASPETPAK